MRNGWRGTIVQGLLAGLVGFFTVAVVFAVANFAAGRSPWYTASLLGAALFDGAADPAQVSVSAGYVLAYSALHLVVFLLFGMLGATLAGLADRGWQLWFVGSFFFVFVSFHLAAAVQWLASPMESAISAGAIWIAGLAATVLMGAYILWMHPRIRARQQW